MQSDFHFRPVSCSWVAIHPQPKGIIQFIGGAFFGTLPTVFYRHFLEQLFDAGYTIVAIPFRFSFRHWSIAARLFVEQKTLQSELTEIARNLGYEYQVYQDTSNYVWIAHSLGCKYVALLELLSSDRWFTHVQNCTTPQIAQRIKNNIEEIVGDRLISIKGQPSLLIAPDISDTTSAVPLRSLAHLLDKMGLGVLPTRTQTQHLIAESNLFNITALVSFSKDDVAGNKQDRFRSQKIQDNSDVLWFIEHLNNRKFCLLHQETRGKHLEPIGIRINEYIVDFNPLDKFIQSLGSRSLEQIVIKFLSELDQREELLKR
jgi:hypothetical protein